MRALETERLHLRPMDDGDYALYCQIYTDTELMRYVGEPLTQKSAEISFRRILELAAGGQAMFWVVIVKKTGKAAGLTAVLQNREMPEIGTMIVGECQGLGFAYEALERVRDTCFQTRGFQSIFGRQLPSNQRSLGLMKKLGFQQAEKDGLIHWRLDRETWQGLLQGHHYSAVPELTGVSQALALARAP